MIRLRTLFLKIFLWFWLAISLIFVAHSLSAMAVFDRGAQGFVGKQISVHALVATEKYEQGGRASAAAYLALLERNTRARLRLHDAQGNELAGAALTPEAGAVLREALARGGDHYDQSARTDFLASWV